MKALYLIRYALIAGETLEYGYEFYRHAVSKEQMKVLFKNHMGKEFRRVREMRTIELPTPVKEESSQQLSMF